MINLFTAMSARFAIPLLLLIALGAGIAGAITGAIFLVVFSIVGFVAAIVGGVWGARKIRSSRDGGIEGS